MPDSGRGNIEYYVFSEGSGPKGFLSAVIGSKSPAGYGWGFCCIPTEEMPAIPLIYSSGSMTGKEAEEKRNLHTGT